MDDTGKQMTATAFIEIKRIGAARNNESFVGGYACGTDEETATAYVTALKRFAVPFDEAGYLVDLYRDQNELVETFPLSEMGYLQLVEPRAA